MEYVSRDVHRTGEDKRFVKLRNRVETGKSNKQAEKGSKKVLGLQEYWDHQGDKTKAAEAAGSAPGPEDEEDLDTDVAPPPCPPVPGLKDLVSQLNQDPRAEYTADSGIGNTAMEEDVTLNAVREESVEDETSCAILDHSSGPDDLMWNEEIPYLEFTDDSTTVCKTPVASSTPAATPAVDTVLSSPESLGNKKQCQETMAERLLRSTEIGEPDYKDAPLVGYTRPDLSRVILWIRFKAQSMMEPPWQTKLAKIKQDDDVWYITAMFVWFRHWKIRSGTWPSLPRCDFALKQETIDTQFTSCPYSCQDGPVTWRTASFESLDHAPMLG